MKLLRSVLWLGVLVIGMSVGCDDGTESFETRKARCSADAALTRDELGASAVPSLCEHQVLVASLRPDDPVVIPFRLVTDAEIEYCFEDDNDEAHHALLFSGKQKLLELTAGEGCVRRHLPPGVYQLHLRHATPGEDDPTPDVIHTLWFPESAPAAGHPSQLLLTSNACPGCDLSGRPWPLLSEDGGGASETRGYDGDYTGANFSDSACNGKPFRGCRLGWRASSASFAGAKFDRVKFPFSSSDPIVFVAVGRDNGTTSFKGASFHAFDSSAGALLRTFFSGNFSGAHFSDARIGRGMMSGDFIDADFSGFRGVPDVVGATLDLDGYQRLVEGGARVHGNIIVIRTRDDLTGAVLDGSGNTILWPKNTSTGRPALAGMSFVGATLTHLNFGCVDGGDLSHTKFTGATLTNVTFSGCDLGGAVFDNATFIDVVARNASFLQTSMRGIRINGLDLSESVVTSGSSDVTLSLAGGAVAQKLVAVGATLDVRTNAFVARQPDFFHANLTDSRWPNAQFLVGDTGGADLGSTTLTRTDFTGATLEHVIFDGATGNASIFTQAHLEHATLDGAHFTGATFDSAHLDQARFTSGRVCGGSSRGVVLNGTNLANTLFPLTSNTYTIDGQTFDCHGVEARDTAVTNGDTTCPDGLLGPCGGGESDQSRWIPVGTKPTCCNPWTDHNCPRRKATGQPCEKSCDCASLMCVAFKCG